MKKSMKRVLALMLAVVMAFLITTTAFPTETYAATKKNKVTATSNSKPTKKTPALKTGDNVVTYKKSSGYVKFTASKKGTYTFTFSGLTSLEKTPDKIGYGYFTIDEKSSYGYYSPIKVKTNKGKKSEYLEVTTKYCYNKYDKKSETSNYLYKRTATLSLKKGETVYIYNFTSIGVNSAKHSVNINVKKK